MALRVWPSCPGCPPLFLPCRWRKLFSAGLLNPSLEGGFPLVAAVLRHLVFQGLHAGSQLANRLMNEGNYRRFPLVVGNADFVITG